MTRFPLILAALLLAAPAVASAQGLTVTGSQGGTMQKTRDCQRDPGQAQCAANTTVTSPTGQTATKQRLRTTGAGVSTTTVTHTNPAGEQQTRTRKLQITN